MWLLRSVDGNVRRVTTALQDDRHDHWVLTDLVGAVLAVAVALVVLVVALAAGGYAVHWAFTLGG